MLSRRLEQNWAVRGNRFFLEGATAHFKTHDFFEDLLFGHQDTGIHDLFRLRVDAELANNIRPATESLTAFLDEQIGSASNKTPDMVAFEFVVRAEFSKFVPGHSQG